LGTRIGGGAEPDRVAGGHGIRGAADERERGEDEAHDPRASKRAARRNPLTLHMLQSHPQGARTAPVAT